MIVKHHSTHNHQQKHESIRLVSKTTIVSMTFFGGRAVYITLILGLLSSDQSVFLAYQIIKPTDIFCIII